MRLECKCRRYAIDQVSCYKMGYVGHAMARLESRPKMVRPQRLLLKLLREHQTDWCSFKVGVLACRRESAGVAVHRLAMVQQSVEARKDSRFSGSQNTVTCSSDPRHRRIRSDVRYEGLIVA